MAVYLTNEQSVPVDEPRLVALARHVVSEEHVPEEMELAIILVDEATIASYNQQHMGKEGPTDVLAFPIDEPGESPMEGPSVLGDVVLCPAVAHAQASEFGRTAEQEVELLTVHGILHLVGMDHADPESERAMFGRTDELLASFASGAAT